MDELVDRWYKTATKKVESPPLDLHVNFRSDPILFLEP